MVPRLTYWLVLMSHAFAPAPALFWANSGTANRVANDRARARMDLRIYFFSFKICASRAAYLMNRAGLCLILRARAITRPVTQKPFISKPILGVTAHHSLQGIVAARTHHVAIRRLAVSYTHLTL